MRFEVRFRDLSDRSAKGWRVWEIPIQGGSVRDDDICIDVRPIIRDPEDSYDENGQWKWRNYKEIERLVVQAEKQGGYIRGGSLTGETIQIGDDILTGRDIVEFLTEGLRRSREREHKGGHYDQGYNDALRDLREAVEKGLNSVSERYG